MTWQIASDSRMFARNLLPRPHPRSAAADDAGDVTKSTVAGSTRAEPKISASVVRRESGTPTTPTLGSMVANG